MDRRGRNPRLVEESGQAARQEPSERQAIPVLVVEDNRLLREGIVSILNRQSDLQVVAVAEDAHAAVSRASETKPRVVLLDAGLGDNDSHGLVEHITRELPGVRVVVMDVLPEPEDIVQFVRRGAAGFVVKEASVDVFLATIRSVAEGAEVLPPALATPLLSHIADHAAARPSASLRRAARMTKREREVIGLIAEGMSNKEIARRLHLSTHTVKSHVRNILEKLALHSRLQVAAYAHEVGPPPLDSL